MKKGIIVLLLVAPMLMFGQRDRAEGVSGKTSVSRTDATQEGSTLFYGEIITMEQQGRIIVRVNFDDASKSLVADKEVRVEIDDLSRTRFGSLLEALNAASALGWNYVSSYESETKNNKMTHYIISHPVEAMIIPALGVRKDADGKGAAGKNQRK